MTDKIITASIKVIVLICMLMQVGALRGFGQKYSRTDSLSRRLGDKLASPNERFDRLVLWAEQLYNNSPKVAERYAGEALEIAINNDDLEKKMIALYLMGKSKAVMSDYNSAYELYYESIRISDSLNNYEWKVKNLNSLGIGNYESKDLENALKYWNQAKLICEEQKDSLELSKMYNNIGLVYRTAEHFDSALIKFEKSRLIAASMAFDKGVGVAIMNKGTTYSMRGDFEQAMQYFDQATDIILQLDSKKSLMNLKMVIAKANLRAAYYAEARRLLLEAKELAVDLDAKTFEQEIHFLLSEIYERLGMFPLALESFKKYNFLDDSLKSAQAKMEIAELEAVYENEQKDKENKLLKLENAKRLSELEAQKARLSRQFIIILSISLGLILLVVFSVYSSFLNKKLKLTNTEMQQLNKTLEEQKHKIEVQSKELSDKNAAIEEMNIALEAKVLKRTQELEAKNRMLKSYAYANSHKVRGPLARILGLVDLIQKEKQEKQIVSLAAKLEVASTDMDKIIREISDQLHDGFEDATS